MIDTTRKSDFDDIPLDGFRRDAEPVPQKKKEKIARVKKVPDDENRGFLPSNTPIPFWLDVVFFFLWCGGVGLSIVTAFFMANLFLGVLVFVGGGALILAIRMAIKRFLLARA